MPARLDRARPFASPSVRYPAKGADFGEFAAQLAPGIAGIVARIDLAVMAAGKDPRGVGRMRRKGPDRRVRLDRQRPLLPGPAAVARALDRAGAADRGIAGRDEQRLRVVRLLRETAAVAQVEPVAHAEAIPAFA